MPHEQHGDKRDDADKIQDWSLIQNKVVVHPREHKHQYGANDDPSDLLHVHPGKPAAVRGGVDFDHAKGANGCENGQQPPVVIACSGRVLHHSFRFSPGLRLAVSSSLSAGTRGAISAAALALPEPGFAFSAVN